jgi:hypothetical protein
MAEPAITLNEGGAVREARRPFSSFFRRWLGDKLPESVQPAKTERQPDEQEEEFWDPRQGQPPTAAVQPMRPQAPRWKKDNPGLTDPLLDADDEDWIHQPYRSRSQAFARKPEQDSRCEHATTAVFYVIDRQGSTPIVHVVIIASGFHHGITSR